MMTQQTDRVPPLRDGTSPVLQDVSAGSSPTEPAPPDGFARYARQARLPQVGRQGQERLRAGRVLLVGCGALGGAVADHLVRAGVGRLTVVDRDYVELNNLQRQTLFDEEDAAAHLPKAEAAAARLRRVNGEVEVVPVVADANATDLEDLARDADAIVDGLDNFETRYVLNDLAVKLGRPWVYGGVVGTSGLTMTVRPGETACLRCVFPDPPEAGSAPTCDTAGVLGPAVALVAAVQAAETIKLLVGDTEATNRDLLSLDAWSLAFGRVPLPGPVPGCPACGQRRFPFLEEGWPAQTTTLCGRDAVQVLVRPTPTLDLEELAARLAPIGRVDRNRFLLRFRPVAEGRELTVFADGRAIVKGTDDPAEARSVYARYVGV